MQRFFADFLRRVRADIVDAHSLRFPSVYLSYVHGPSTPHQLDIACVVNLLCNSLTLLNFNVTAEPLPSLTAELCNKLSSHELAVILCTREYAEAVSKSPGMKDEIIAFGKRRTDALHTLLLYKGRFADGANKVIARNFLARLCNPIIQLDIADPLASLIHFFDVFTFLSGSQGLGILPDLMDLEIESNHALRKPYQQFEDALQMATQTITVDYRLHASLLENYHGHPLISVFPAEEIPNAKKLVDDLTSSSVKVSLVLCPTRIDSALMGLVLEQHFLDHSWRCISIDCARYPGNTSHQCVAEELHKASLKTHDSILAVRAAPIVILFKGYDFIGTYDNLFVKNQLASWPQVKVLVTCQMDIFQHRSHASSFLPDPTVPRIELLQVTEIHPFASELAKKASLLSAQHKPEQPVATTSSLNNTKRRAQHAELAIFLRKVHALLVAEGVLKEKRSHNPRVFISYAWEQNKDLVIQQNLLRQIVVDLQTLGLPAWLDVERMTGDIDQQMAGNIATSSFALVIGTPRYCERAEQDTNVRKEYLAILDQEKNQTLPLQLLPILFGEHGQLPQLMQENALSLNNITRFEAYSAFITDQLVPCLLGKLRSSALAHFDNLAIQYKKQQILVPAKHLVVEHNQDMIQSHDMDNRLVGHIPTFGLARLDSPVDTRYNLQHALERFLASDTKTIVMFGEAGSGKSLFALSIFKTALQEWHTYRNSDELPLPNWLPIYIPLRSFSQGMDDFVSTSLAAFNLDEGDIRSLREGLGQNQKVLFILDGYDELGGGKRPNIPQMLANWPHAKILITCRPEHFEYESQHLTSFAIQGQATTFETHYVAPFVQDEVKKYVMQSSGEKEYEMLQEISGLLALLSNPFVLNLTLQSLPQLQHKFLSQQKKITRTSIYQAFSEYWFGKEAFKRELEENECKLFTQRLAFAFFTHNTAKISPGDPLWPRFFGEYKPVQNTCPLRRNNQEFSFLHKSLFEFFAACHLWDSLFSSDSESRTNSWGARMLTEEYAIIYFLNELYQDHPQPQLVSDQLLQLVYSSRDITSTATPTASANAITVLNFFGFSFSGMNLSNICIPGADLSGAVMHHTVLRGSDLRGVSLGRSCLNSTDFSLCNLAGINLGESQQFGHNNWVSFVALSHDGKFLATSMSGTVLIWLVESHEIVATHEIWAQNLMFAPNSYKLAFKAYGSAAVWDLESGNSQILEGTCHSMAFLPDGNRLVYFSNNNVQVWDLTTQQSTLIGKPTGRQIDHPISVAFSFDGSKVAFRGREVMWWDLATGILSHHEPPFDVSEPPRAAFSPDCRKLVYGTSSAVKVWDIDSGDLYTLQRHNAEVTAVAFSPDGSKIASGSADNIVIVSDLIPGRHHKNLATLQRHSAPATHLVFSTNSLWLASSSGNTARVWDLTHLGHGNQTWASRQVMLLAFPPDGSHLFTGGGDEDTATLWDLTFGKHQSLRAPRGIEAVAYSHNSQFLAFGYSNDGVQVWDFKSKKKQILTHLGGNLLAFSPDDGKLATSDSHRVLVWDFTNGHCQLLQHKYFANGISGLVFLSRETLITCHNCTYYGGVTAVEWNLQNKSYKLLLVRSKTTNALALSRDGAQLATTTFNTVEVWVLKRRTCQTLQGVYTRQITSATFSPQGHSLASCDGFLVTVWNLQRRNHQSLPQQNPITCMAFSSDDSLAVCTSVAAQSIVDVWVRQTQHAQVHPSSLCLCSGRKMEEIVVWVKVFTSWKVLDTTDCILTGCIGLSETNRSLMEKQTKKQ